MNKSFCVFILTHGRANNCHTYKSLIKIGYDGPLFFLVDNEDKQIDLYKENFGEERVIVFDKLSISKKTDCADNFQNRRVILHARNACFDVARELGFDYFLELDDDYTGFDFLINSDGSFGKNNLTKNITKVFFSFIDFLESSERIASICFLQGGDLIGGIKCTTLVRGLYPFSKRKAMNSFFCKTSRRFWFTGTINEDVNTYLSLGSRGVIFLSIPLVVLYQKMTQQNAGGMTDAYIASGTYVKSFYSVMINPSSAIVYLGDKGNTVGRLHHRINWNNAVPKILDESNKKA